MELVLDHSGPDGKETGGKREDGRTNAGWTSWALRIALALAAVGAAYLIMAGPAPAAIAHGIGGSTPGTVPGPLGHLLAALPCAS
jgi:hypothetical protein